MIEDSKKKNFDYVLVYQLDRFARNRYDSANYKAKCKRAIYVFGYHEIIVATGKVVTFAKLSFD